MILESICAVCVLLALLLLIAAVRRLRRGRIAGGAFCGGGALLLLLGAAGALALAVGVRGFQRLGAEQSAGEIRFMAAGPRAFDAVLTLADGRRESFLLRGDDWQVDGRILKWRALANVLGFDALYRLERIGGRYERIEEERHAPRTVYALNPPGGIDLWEIARRYRKWLPWVDALYGSATYTPMADGAVFEIDVSQSGLLARPRNPAARAAIGGWH
ncbi:MAG TPA: hypothetical protein VMV25_12180 [Steroidobacteraceae bacterium]|nr:hypothetical protein [Steroidobacteraceae bacterium]